MLSVRRDDGQLTLLIIGFFLIAATLVLVAVDASKVFLARRSLSSLADAAALRAAQSLDRDAVYAGAVGCGSSLPVDPVTAEVAVGAAVDDDVTDLRHMFAVVDVPETSVDGGTVTVRLSGDVSVPFGRVLRVLLPGHAPTVHVTATSAAESPVTAPGGC